MFASGPDSRLLCRLAVPIHSLTANIELLGLKTRVWAGDPE